jgi:hypothetical protein
MKPVLSSNHSSSRLAGLRGLAIVLLVALLHGLVYLVLMPPWQHYDEPNHFEVVWLVAKNDRFPTPGDYDPTMSRAVVESMVANNFFVNLSLPDLSLPEIRIPGLSQFGEQPLYYFLAAIPLKLLPTAGVETQLYAARCVSLLFFFLSILAAWGVGSELFPPGHWMRWLLPLSIALLPAFADIMTAVNNDSAAIAIASYFIWGSVRLVRKGFSGKNPDSLLDAVWVVLTAVLAYLAKTTAFVCLLVLPVVFSFALVRGRSRRLVWAGLLVVFLLALVGSFRWGDAALWHRATSQPAATRQLNDRAVLGKYVLMLSSRYPKPQSWLGDLSQLFPENAARQMRGQMVTLGVWMWADQPTNAYLPFLMSYFPPLRQVVKLGTEPAFFAYQLELPADSEHIIIALQPGLKAGQNILFYYDGIVLALGGRPLDEIPRFTQPDGSQGEWGGQPFTNLIRNPSAEDAGPRIYQRLDDLGAHFLPDNTRPSMFLSSLFDWSATGFFYKLSAGLLLKRFWAVFGWAQILLRSQRVYTWLSAITLAGMVGAGLAGLRRQRRLPWDLVFVLGFMVMVTWGLALVRGTSFLYYTHLYYTVARHGYPVIIPTLLCLILGWREDVWVVEWLWHLLGKKFHISDRITGFVQSIFTRRLGLAVYVLLFLALDFYSIWSIASYYSQI